MKGRVRYLMILMSLLSVLQWGCKKAKDMVQGQVITVGTESVAPGTSVKLMGVSMSLHQGGENLAVGKPIAPFTKSMEPVEWQGKVSVVSFVPAIQTRVCEQQTHQLGESKTLDPRIQRITISRESSEIQQAFAKEAGLTNITYLSDSKERGFGEASGLLIPARKLLARGVAVVDQNGIIQYLQVVPELSDLPDMEKAFAFANGLVK